LEELLFKLKKLGVRISVEDDNLKLNIPEEVDESLFLQDIRANKQKLISFIKNRTSTQEYKSIPKSEKTTSIKLTPTQARLFVLQELAKNTIAYNIPFAFEINGVLDVKRLENALLQLIRRHESLRTSFVLDDQYQPIQKIEEDIDFTLQLDKYTKEELNEIIGSFSQPFHLDKAPLLRASLVNTSRNEYVLLIDVHHIIFDGLSFQIFLQDLMSIYMGISLPELTIQYKDYANWYYGTEYQEYLLNQKSFWLQELSGYTNTAILPTDFQRPNEISFEGEQVHFKISTQQKQIIDKLKKNSEVSLFSVLLSLFGVLQSKLTRVDDLVIGTPVGGRKHDDLKNIIGMFVNTLGIRFNPRPNIGFIHFLKEVGKKTLMCFDHQEYPFEELLEDLDLNNTNEVNPLFNTMITLNNIQQAKSELKDFNVKPYEISKSTSKFDLMIHFNETEDELGCTFEYSTKLFKKETIELFFKYLKNIIDQIGGNNDVLLKNISLLDNSTYRTLLEINDFTDVNFPREMTLVTMFESQVKKTPERIALQFGDEFMTYRELNARANKVARLLKNNGVQTTDIVGLLTGKSFETIIGMLGVLKAGGAYLPIDVTYPEKRISYTLESSKAKILLTLKEFKHIVDNDTIALVCIEDIDTITDVLNPEPINKPNDLCYVLYTSGTTGNPKGVMIEHQNVVRLLFNDKFQYNFGEEDIWTMFHSHCFDVSVWEMYGAFLNGGKLIIIPADTARDPKKYLKILHENAVTVLNQTPTAFYNLAGEALKQGIQLPKIRYVIFAGEALSPLKLKDWHQNQPNAKLINMYGITEVTVHMTYKEIGTYEIENGISNIGRPLHTGSIYLLDENLQPVPKGVIGEIYVGGEGVGRGYLHNESLTSARFIKNPFKDGDRLYKSGDLAILLSNGELEYKGRSDHQIQLRGFRIELGEIENQLLKHDAIENAIVLDKRDKGDDQPYLCAYIVAKEELTTEELRGFLAELVPFYMIPAYFMQISKIPYTTNNKIDKTKLPAPKPTELSKYKAPEIPAHEIMVVIWMKVLAATKIGIQDNFFFLGGDSLKAIGLIAEINEKLQSSLNIADLYANQTIEKLSIVLKQEDNSKHAIYHSKAKETLQKFEESYKVKGMYKESYEAVYPMNGVEIGMVFHTLKEKSEEKNIHNIIYHEQNVYPLPSGNFNFTIFKKALNLLLKKHSVLRKIYDIENLAHIILKEVNPEVNFMDISNYSRNEQEKLIENKKQEERLKETKLDFALIWRMTIIKASNSHHYLLFDFHHSLFGGWSLNSFTTELNNVYFQLLQEENFKPTLLKSTYKDQILGEIVASIDEENMAYWKEELSDYKRLEFSNTYLEHEFKMDKYDLGSEFRQELEKVASAYNTSFKHLCFAAYVYVMKMFSPTNDVTVGIVANNRPLTPDGDKLLGCFLNTVPFRAEVPENVTWGEYIKYIEDKLRKFKKHEKVPFYKILEITKESANERNPIFDTSFNYMDFHIINDMVREESLEPIEEGVAGFDNYVNNNTLFDLHITASNNAFKLWLAYSTTIIDKTLSSRIYEYFKAVLHNFVNNEKAIINQNDILSKQQKLQIEGFNNTSKPIHKDKTLTSWFAKQVLKTPNAIALTYENIEITYAQLDTESNQLARQLQAFGVAKKEIVGIMQYRSPNMIISILGILKSGGAYLPIDHSYPTSRIEAMISDSKMTVILTDEYTDAKIDTEIQKLNVSEKNYQNQDSGKLVEQNVGEDVLYVLYTSGSTGIPKGVGLSHNNLINLLDYYHTAKIESRSVLQFTPLIFDPSFSEIFSALLSGGTIHFLSEESSRDFTAILNKIQDKRVDTIFMPNSVLNQLFNSTHYQEILPNTLSNIISAGEQVVVGDLFKKYILEHNIHLHNHYGPAETHVVTAHKILPTKNLPQMPHIGFPVQNTQIHVLSEGKHIQPVGIAGEIYIGGAQVGLGYLNRPELNEERFIPNPYGAGKLYRTGDLANWNNDGSLTFLGRKDFQVKLNGVRIELGEIEYHLNDISGISDSTVLLKEVSGNKILVGYYLATEEILEEKLTTYLSGHLPLNMVPNHYVHMQDFPLTATGKLDRKSFPLPETSSKYIVPETHTEKKIVSIWSEVLQIDALLISSNSSFFDLGGNSLKAMMMINVLKKSFSVNILLKSIFRYSTIASLAAYIETLDKNYYLTIPKVAKASYYPLSSAQQRMYFLYEFDKLGTTYNMPSIFEITGELDVNHLRNVFQQLIERHYSLRAQFKIRNNQTVQTLVEDYEFEIPITKIENLTDDHIKGFVRPFDIFNELLIRVEVLRINTEKYVLMLDMHHIISDGISLEILIRDFWRLYKNETLEPLALQYIDYATWQQSDDFLELMNTHKSYWLNSFSEDIQTLELPTDYARPAYLNDEGLSCNIELSSKQSENIRVLAHSQGVTPYTVLLTIYNIFLSKLSSKDDIVIGTATSGRLHADLAPLVGMFVNTLPLRNKPKSNDSFETFLASVQENTLVAFDHQLYQYEDLVDALEIERNTSRNPLFDVFFLYNDAIEVDSLENETISVKPSKSFATKSKFDLSFEVSVINEHIKLSINGRKDLFKPTTLKRFGDYISQIISQVVADKTLKIETIEMLSQEERTMILETFNTTKVAFDKSDTVLDMFRSQVRKTPGAIALVLEEEELTYKQLDARSNQWAASLIYKGVSKGDFIGLIMDRSIEMIVAILAVLKSGAAYVPIAPNQPSDRIKHILEEINSRFVITNVIIPNQLQTRYTFLTPEELIISSESEIDLQLPSQDDVAYIIYTSGSTGLPKGVVIQHKNVTNFIHHEKVFLNVEASDVILQFSPYYFDVSVQQIWMTLTTGAKLVLIKEDYLGQPNDFANYLDTHKVTILNTTPSFLEKSEILHIASLKKIVVSGEECKPKLAAKYVDNYEFYNEYGPTETTVIAIASKVTKEMTKQSRLTIGTPVSNVKAYILNKELKVVPIGSTDHLYLSGAGVGQGYLNRPELTNAHFLDNPYGDGHLYKTGDLAAWNDDGTIVFIGRDDQQIKLNGVRIELGEIENKICDLLDVKDCVVVIKEHQEEKVLVAYYISENDISEIVMKTHLLDKIPMNMIPRYYVPLESFPTTVTGKLDRNRLPVLQNISKVYIAPDNEVEKQLTVIWADLLRLEAESISVNETFFNLGGNSLKAITLINTISKDFSIELSVKEMFIKQTIRAISDYIITVQQLDNTNNIENAKLIL
jgi:tyrocidine synthetase III